MSVLFGMARLDEQATNDEAMARLAKRTDRWAGDGSHWNARDQVAMGLQPDHTHPRSHLHAYPEGDPHGNRIALDGRLDNRDELRHLLELPNDDASDAIIMLASFDRWGESCFAKFIGDWAVVLWWERDRSLYLARDHAGTRTLYYQINDQCAVWGTYLETFVSDESLPLLSESFALRYLLGQSSNHTTPLEDVRAVPPAHWLQISRKGIESRCFWEPFPATTLRYKNEREYDARFVHLFEQSVARRVARDGSTIAHLSGGVDSTSIVCIADRLQQRAQGSGDRLLETLSLFSNNEPSWDERPFFTAVERYRGQSGIHFDVSEKRPTLDLACDIRMLLPGYDSGAFAHETRIEEALAPGRYRSVVSGLGGDELFGGVPTPLPELSDAVIKLRLLSLLRRGVLWSLALRQPLWRTLLDSGGFAYQSLFGPGLPKASLPPWLKNNALQRLRLLLENDSSSQRSVRRLTRLPSQIATAAAFHRAIETLPQPQMFLLRRREYRFPFLDRDLVEFALSLPPEQLVTPGRRRYLMRRALKGIVPDAVLERRRKAFLERSPLQTLIALSTKMRDMMRTSLLQEMGYIDPEAFLRCLEEEIKGGTPRWRTALMRTCQFELWLRSGVVRLP